MYILISDYQKKTLEKISFCYYFNFYEAVFLFRTKLFFYFFHRLFANVCRFCFEDKGKTCLSICKVKSARDSTKNLPLIESSIFFAKTLHLAKSLPLRQPSKQNRHTPAL